MVKAVRPLPFVLATAISLLLSACGGGGSGGSENSSISSSSASNGNAQTVSQLFSQEPGAPQATGNTATDGINWFNFRRRQMGLATLQRNALIDTAAQGHSNYQRQNNVITHDQTEGLGGYTGKTLAERLGKATYAFTSDKGYAYGEVIASTGTTSGFSAAEDLITAIYHRFVAFEPMFKEVGAGSATVTGGNTFFTADFVANGLDAGLGSATAVVYPFANQARVPTNFFSNNESPDPVSDRDEVGYPVSVHTDIVNTLTVGNFSIKPRGGNALPVYLLRHETDPNTRSSMAAIIPVEPLAANTTYDVQFTGTIKLPGNSTTAVPYTQSWSFTTR